MKNILLLVLNVVVVFSLYIVGCNSAKYVEKEIVENVAIGNINPQELEAINGIVNFDYTINFKPKEFKKNMILKITPRVQYGDLLHPLEPIYFQGENVKGHNYPVVKYNQASTFTKQYSFTYYEGMQDAVLWAEVEGQQKNRSLPSQTISIYEDGIRNWYQPDYSLEDIRYIPAMTDAYVGQTPAMQAGVVSGYVLFPSGESDIPVSEQNSAMMDSAEKIMKKVIADKDATITNMFVYVSNSPEGSERTNKNLVDARFKNAKEFFVRDLNLQDKPFANAPEFIVEQEVEENWPGLYMLLEDSELKNKEQIIKDLKSAPNSRKRDIILNNYMKLVPELKNEILPVLRRADFFVFYTSPTIEGLNVQTTCFVPQLMEHTPAVNAQTNWQLLNDLAVVAIKQREFDKAQRILESATRLREEPVVDNNMGIAYARAGEKIKAKEMFDKAAGRSEARYNLGLVLLQEENYDKAEEYLKEEPNVHLAYIQLKKKNNEEALQTFKNVRLTQPMDYYMMAVAAARVQNIDDMSDALQKAVEMEPALKDMARNDINFREYKDNVKYKQIIKK